MDYLGYSAGNTQYGRKRCRLQVNLALSNSGGSTTITIPVTGQIYPRAINI